MTKIERPSTEELWQIVQEEQARSRRLEEETRELRRQLEQRRAGQAPIVRAKPEAAGHRDQKVSRAKLLTGAGLAGAALIGSQAKPAFAQTPPPIPSFTAFPNPRRVMVSAMTFNTTSGAISALTTTSNTSTGVPVGAQAAWAAVQANQPGSLTLFPDGNPDPGIANWYGSGASFNLLYMLVPLSSAGAFRVHAYLSGTIYVDVWGYLY